MFVARELFDKTTLESIGRDRAAAHQKEVAYPILGALGVLLRKVNLRARTDITIKDWLGSVNSPITLACQNAISAFSGSLDVESQECYLVAEWNYRDLVGMGLPPCDADA